MFKNYMLITFRTLYREKTYALINILGLAMAIACCLILFLYIRSELTYDQHNIKHDKIVRVAVKFTANGRTSSFAKNSSAFGPLLIKEYPQIGEYLRFQKAPRTAYKYEDNNIFWTDVYLADDNVFDVFSHNAIYGDFSLALKDPNSIVISQSFSKRYFGDDNPVGKTIETDATFYKIDAVFEDLPDNSHLKYSALTSMNILRSLGLDDEEPNPNRLIAVSDYVFFLLADDMDRKKFQHLLKEFYEKKAAQIGKEFGLEGEYFTQSLADIHFDTGWDRDEPTGKLIYVYGFIAVAVFILLVACINYTNLATARTIKRAKEVGMRKVIGAERSQLVVQFLGESLFYAFAALLLGLAFVELAGVFTSLNSLLGKTSLLNLSDEPLIFSWIIAGTVIVALLAGSYPAFYLSSIPPLSVIRASKSGRSSDIKLGHILVFLQIFASVAILGSTLVMRQQMDYISNKSLGFNKENKLAVMLQGGDVLEKFELIKNELLKNSRVLGVTRTSFVPGGFVELNLQTAESNEGGMEVISVSRVAVDRDFVKVMGIELVEGRDFSSRLLTDKDESIVVNETLVKRMGWEQAIGKQIIGGVHTARVVGVMKDFHFKSLHEPVTPMFFNLLPKVQLQGIPAWRKALMSSWVIINVQGDDILETINTIDSVITQFDPNHPFELKYFDELLRRDYQSEINLMKLTSAFSAICIFISCMGLFGLAAFTTEQRTREIGVRKVLGASTWEIIAMLSKNMIYMVIVAALLASLVSYSVMDKFLNVFAYRTDISIWNFVFASFAVAIVAFLTVALQSAKTAQSNPVVALRYE